MTLSATLEWRLACNHLVKHDTQTKNIRAGIDRVSLSLFGRHVTTRANNCSWTGCSDRNCHSLRVGCEHVWFGQFCETKIEYFYKPISSKPVFTQHNVLGFYVAMNDSSSVRRFKRHRDLNPNAENFI